MKHPALKKNLKISEYLSEYDIILSALMCPTTLQWNILSHHTFLFNCTTLYFFLHFYSRISFKFFPTRSFLRFSIRSNLENGKNTDGENSLVVDDICFSLRVMFLFQNHPT